MPAKTDPTEADAKPVHLLVGLTVASCRQLRDIDGARAWMFVFTDLSVRTVGMFRLRFTAFDVRESTVIAPPVFSDTFEVFTPQRFPGLVESSPLAKHLRKQAVANLRITTKAD
ncbi:velvet factor [Blyttiomyces helicus]|uniref:Velvet factor n=1 Tax=Blyttiomyces helicus TaxID=388810 RepID=A0A4P9WEF3_9FUNG|nr:velvet factor [Blyttiomyces helicus]|eukprot:RKO90083.1 velvet factor [Blyttiomyces helicus]